jgi:hypothetical protein
MEEIFSMLIKQNMTPNTFYILYSVHSSIKPNAFVNVSLELEKLKRDNWISDDLILSEKSVNFMKEVEGFFKKSKKKTSKLLLGSEFEENIKKYSNAFPSIKLGSGKYARSNVKNLENSFRWFFENYDYEWDTIIKATERYVREYKLSGYNYMRTSQYFIRKQNTDKTWDSDLADYCELILNPTDDDIIFIKERVM